MARLLQTNDAITILATDMAAGDASLIVYSGHGALFPATGDFMLRIGSGITAGSFEYCRATARASDTITVTRAQAGTSAIAHAAGTLVWLVIDATTINEIWDAIDALGP